MNDRDYWAGVANGAARSRAEQARKEASLDPRRLRQIPKPKSKGRRRKA